MLVLQSHICHSHGKYLFSSRFRFRTDLRRQEREAAAAAAANFNQLQMKLATTNCEMDEELRVLRKDKKALEDQCTSLSVFEQGVADMRALLDDAVHARDEALEDLDRLAQLQKKHSLTWVPSSAVKFCMQVWRDLVVFFQHSRPRSHSIGIVFILHHHPCSAGLSSASSAGAPRRIATLRPRVLRRVLRADAADSGIRLQGGGQGMRTVSRVQDGAGRMTHDTATAKMQVVFIFHCARSSTETRERARTSMNLNVDEIEENVCFRVRVIRERKKVRVQRCTRNGDTPKGPHDIGEEEDDATPKCR